MALLVPVALLNYLDRQMIAAMKTSVMSDVSAITEDSQWAFMLGQFKWCYAIFSPIDGVLADRFSRRWTIGASLFCFSTHRNTGTIYKSTIPGLHTFGPDSALELRVPIVRWWHRRALPITSPADVHVAYLESVSKIAVAIMLAHQSFLCAPRCLCATFGRRSIALVRYRRAPMCKNESDYK